MNRLMRGVDLGARSERVRRVQISIKRRECAAGDVHTQLMTFRKQHRRAGEIDREGVSPARLEEPRMAGSFAVACPQDSIGDRNCSAIGIHIDEPRHEVRIGGIGGSLQYHVQRAYHFEITAEWLGRINKGVRARLNDVNV